MSIIHCVVKSGSKIIAKHSICEGNFKEIVNSLLEKVPYIDDKKTYFHGKYLFHYVVESKRVYLCITDKTCQRSRAFLFLNEIKRKLLQNAKSEYSEILAKEMFRYGAEYANISVRNGELDELNNISVESSEKLLGEKLLIVKYNPSESIQYSNIIDFSSNSNMEAKHGVKFKVLKFTCAILVFIGIIYIIYSKITFNSMVVIVILLYFISKWRSKV